MSSDARAGKRVTVNLRASDVDRVSQLAEETGLNANEIIRHALATEAYVAKVRKEGRRLLVEDSQGNIREVEFVI